MIKAILKRNYEPKQTIGHLYVEEDGKTIFSCASLELPWLENRRNISCVPEATYIVKKRKAAESPSRNYDHFILQNVPNRSYILIHTGNFKYHVKGCILVGESHSDINSDGLLDVINSTKTLRNLYEILPEEFQLTITQ